MENRKGSNISSELSRPISHRVGYFYNPLFLMRKLSSFPPVKCYVKLVLRSSERISRYLYKEITTNC